MEYLRLFILGLVQGLTEFLPVSSSGHLAASSMLLKRLGIAGAVAEPPLLLDLLLHLGTLGAVIVFFRREILDALRGTGRALAAIPHRQLRQVLCDDEGARLSLAVVVGSVPTAIIGLALEEHAAQVGLSPVRLGLAFLACALILMASRFIPQRDKPLDLKIALLVGVVQGIAVLPGVSRSGSTIAAGLALGLSPQRAASLSFLLSLPAIVGASILELDADAVTTEGLGPAYLLGAVTALVSGLLALKLLVMIVQRGRLWAFAPYVALVGSLTMLLL
jgi:undecaprenyl-diphosphatase